MNKYNFLIEEQHHNMRIDKVLCKLLTDMSRSNIQKTIKANRVLINDRIISDSSYQVKHNDILDFMPIELTVQEIVPVNIELDIIFEDEYLIIINKPVGLTVHPGSGNYSNTLVNALLLHTSTLSDIGGIERPGIVHRLDKNTSGLMVVAKTNFVHIKLAEALQARSLIRKYKALIWGKIVPLSGTINLNIGRHHTDRKRMAITKTGGKQAITHYNTEKLFLDNKISLITCKLETGRTHQIRVHLSYSGHSVIGDPTYGANNKKINLVIPHLQELFGKFNRQALHSYYLAFSHPVSEKFMEFEIMLPDDMKQLISYLE